MPPRPAGTDGSDHAYRMTIENRYKKQADTRKLMQRLAKLSSALVVLKLAWTVGLPLLKGGVNLLGENYALAGAAVAALLLYIIGSGATPLLRENAIALQAYVSLQLLVAVLAARDAGRLFFWAEVPHAELRAGPLLAQGLAGELKVPQNAALRFAWCLELGMALCVAIGAVAASKAGSRLLRIQAAAEPARQAKKGA
ncbi:hypothetical protein WJX81_005733 [Elliptochloris bilobata]|uniref:Uncharacterized protein n=1 Tax=Elliptochloris bilobata TaxID=381761 RepID=A0AAW1RZL0_9CHLO